MSHVIVVPTFDTQEEHLQNILGFRNKVPEAIVYVVDNSSEENKYRDIFEQNNIIYEKSIFGGAYEPGALLQAYRKFDADKYLLIQDSIEISNSDPVYKYFLNTEEAIIAYQFVYPSTHYMEQDNFELLEKMFPNIMPHLDKFFGIAHSTFFCNRNHIQLLIDNGILVEDKLPKNKNGQQVWERIFGFSFCVLGLKLAALGFVVSPKTLEEKKEYLRMFAVDHIENGNYYFKKKHFARK